MHYIEDATSELAGLFCLLVLDSHEEKVPLIIKTVLGPR